MGRSFARHAFISFLSGLIAMFVVISLLSPRTFMLASVPKLFHPSIGNQECIVPRMKSLDYFFKFGKKNQVPCQNTNIFGGGLTMKDGNKKVCLDDYLHIIPGKCTVLSFGINNEWSFDEDMEKFGCQVYAFDPSMGKDDFNRSEKIHFYNLGLSDFQGKLTRKNENDWNMDRYENIIKKLRLTNVEIDYLKMDIEKDELKFLDDVFKNSPHLLKKIKQIGMEIHPQRPPLFLDERSLKSSLFWKYWQAMHRLQCFGFRIANYEMNPVRTNHYQWKENVESNSYEILWVRVP